MESSNNNNILNNNPIKRIRTSKAGNSDGRKRIQKPQLKENKVPTSFTISEYSSFCRDVNNYFKELYNNKEFTVDEIASLKFKIAMLMWRIDTDYEFKKLFELSKKDISVTSSPQLTPKDNNNLFTDF